MNFERHKDPKESLAIGLSTIPIEILFMYTIDHGPNSGGHADMSDKDVKRILLSISKGELDGGWETRYLVGKPVNRNYKKKGIGSITFHIISLKECRGYYVEFQSQKYLIPVE